MIFFLLIIFIVDNESWGLGCIFLIIGLWLRKVNSDKSLSWKWKMSEIIYNFEGIM